MIRKRNFVADNMIISKKIVANANEERKNFVADTLIIGQRYGKINCLRVSVYHR